jgi:hypothetical protein
MELNTRQLMLFAIFGLGLIVLILALAISGAFSSGGGGGAGSAFTTADVPNGTNPEASFDDTLVLIEGPNITITGDGVTDSITIGTTGSATNAFTTIDVPTGTDPVATSATDTLIIDSPTGTVSIVGSDPDTVSLEVVTAPALSADPDDCAANEFAQSIDAEANLTCVAIVDADVPNDITIDLATTATALAADPTDCAADTKADAIDAEGDLTCSAVDTGDIFDNTIGYQDIDYNLNWNAGAIGTLTDECYFTSNAGAGGFFCEGSVTDDMEHAWIFPDINPADGTIRHIVTNESGPIQFADGRSLTAATGVLNADPELYTQTHTLWIENPTAADDFETIWFAGGSIDYTIVSISCESDQTVNFDLLIDDGSSAAVNGGDIACTTFATDASLGGTTLMGAGDRLDLAITSVSGTPTWVSITWTVTAND